MNILPEGAYKALEALKEQAKAVSANNMKGDKDALVKAQSKMSDNIDWSKKIAGFLLSNDLGVNIDNVTNEHIEHFFFEQG